MSRRRSRVSPTPEGNWSNPVQLTNFEGHTGRPRRSPDGKKLVFDSLEGGDYNIYVVDAEGGKPRRLTPESSADFVPTWSHDGQFVYFTSDRRGQAEIWKVGADGRSGGSDGRYLYFKKLTLIRSRRAGRWNRLPLGCARASGDSQAIRFRDIPDGSPRHTAKIPDHGLPRSPDTLMEAWSRGPRVRPWLGCRRARLGPRAGIHLPLLRQQGW